jgi:hypothetical protein
MLIVYVGCMLDVGWTRLQFSPVVNHQQQTNTLPTTRYKDAEAGDDGSRQPCDNRRVLDLSRNVIKQMFPLGRVDFLPSVVLIVKQRGGRQRSKHVPNRVSAQESDAPRSKRKLPRPVHCDSSERVGSQEALCSSSE